MNLLTISEMNTNFNVSTRLLPYYKQNGLLQSQRKEDFCHLSRAWHQQLLKVGVLHIMENKEIRIKFERALDCVIEKFRKDNKCIAAFLIGSMSHDLIWEWSDLQILVIYDDSFKGKNNYYLMEKNV